jgi:hypothetical protein
MNSIAWVLSKLRFPIPQSLGGTGKAVIGEAAVGPVSQASGIPTGAIVERGANGGREWVKYADGTMILWTASAPYLTGSISANNVGTAVTLTFPVSFVDANFTIAASAGPNSTNDHYGVTNANGLSANTANVVIRNGATAQTFYIRFIAIGRWY